VVQDFEEKIIIIFTIVEGQKNIFNHFLGICHELLKITSIR